MNRLQGPRRFLLSTSALLHQHRIPRHNPASHSLPVSQIDLVTSLNSTSPTISGILDSPETRTMRLACLALLLSCALTATPQQMSRPTTAPTPVSSKWPTKDNTYVIKNFHFGTGETLPELTLRYL